jgi:hypothetical protein
MIATIISGHAEILREALDISGRYTLITLQ